MIKKLKGLKRKIQILKQKNNNRLNKVNEEIDITNKSIIFLEQSLEKLNKDKGFIEISNKKLKKEKKEMINICIIAFIILFVVTLIESSIELILGKYLIKILIQKFLLIQTLNVSLCSIMSLILTTQVKRKFKCKRKEEIDKEIEEKSNQLKLKQNKLKELQSKLNNLESIDLNIEDNIQNNFIIEDNNEIYKQKVKK